MLTNKDKSHLIRSSGFSYLEIGEQAYVFGEVLLSSSYLQNFRKIT
jgi:hypothetical protein